MDRKLIQIIMDIENPDYDKYRFSWNNDTETILAVEIVEQLGQRMQLPPDSDVKEGRYLKWRAFRGVSFKTAMEMINELGKSGK